jgi:hypothetical protein
LVPEHPSNMGYTKLLARCHVKLGKWQVALQDGWVAVSTNIAFLDVSLY